VSSLTGQDSLILCAENEFAELLRALEQTLSKLKAAERPVQPPSFVRKVRRLLAEIARISNARSELASAKR
jgi:hypothetical protein